LGYYTDGTKRTLTDEQIAIFRHSEIQELVKLYRNEASTEESSGKRRTINLKPENGSMSKPLQMDKSVRLASNSSSADAGSNGSPTPKPQKPQRNRAPKRKYEAHTSIGNMRNDPTEFQDAGESRTYRRICREMDVRKTDSIELDY
jgi:hypothetical protein